MQKVTIENIHKSFSSTFTNLRGEREEEQSSVLKGVNMAIEKGSVTALFGTNGSGKSTLFNIISGLLKPDVGSINYFYQDKNYTLNEIPAYKQAHIGIARLFQGNNIFRNLSVLDNLLVADNNHLGENLLDLFLNPSKVSKAEAFRKQEAHFILNELLGEQNPLWEKRNDLSGNLSLGQQRLLAFARLFMNEKAELYLLDEPCAGVNQDIRNTMARMIQQLQQQGKTVILIEHNIDFAEKVSSYAFYLEEGKIVVEGLVKEVTNNPKFINNYLGK